MALQMGTYSKAVAVTPSDSTVLDCVAFYVGGAGNVALIAKDDTGTVTLTACIVGQIYPIACNKIKAATTASLIVALY